MSSREGSAAPDEVQEPPITWTHEAKFRTRSELLEHRKQEFMPDLSRDLDGDGVVNPKDLFISNIYDKDRDGKLNESEKAAAVKGMAEGVDKGYVWENGYVRKATEVDIYCRNQGWFKSSHVEYDAKAAGRFTRSELHEQRKEKNITSMEGMRQNWDKTHPRFAPLQRFANLQPASKRSDGYPTEYHKRRADSQASVRVRNGLAPQTTELISSTPPSLLYVEHPVHSSQAELVAQRRKDLARSHESVIEKAKEANYRTAQQKKEAKFEEYLQKSAATDKSKTQSDVMEKRRKENLALAARFGDCLPTNPLEPYEGKAHPFFVEDGVVPQQQVYFEKQEDLTDAEYLRNRAYQERKTKRENITERISLSPAPNVTEVWAASGVPRYKNVKWTSLSAEYYGLKRFATSKLGKNRAHYEKTTDDNVKIRLEVTNTNSLAHRPLFSSFTSDFIFREPNYTKSQNKKPRKRLVSERRNASSLSVRAQTALGFADGDGVVSEQHEPSRSRPASSLEH